MEKPQSNVKSNSRTGEAIMHQIRPKARYDLAVVGHIAIDYIRRGKTTYPPQLGSPCVYASLGARALGASAVVASTVGRELSEEKLAWLRAQGIDTSHVRRTKSSTTSFKIEYGKEERAMQLLSKCSPLTARDISNLPSSSAIHIGPIVNEVPQSLALSLTERNAITSLDPQGYVRRILRDGTVSKLKWQNWKLLKKIDVLKVSEAEATNVIGRISLRKLRTLIPGIILITKGKAGTILLSRDQGTVAIPAYRTRVRDPTGAGDALVGAFLTTWIRTHDLAWSAAVGSAVASFVVEEVGPTSFGTTKQVEQRAKKISDGIFQLHAWIKSIPMV
jgi:sugar/nucleoside kinase (ribokinase family)